MKKTINDCYIEVNNVNTHYLSAGEEGSVLILLHGVGCSAEFWEKNIIELAKNHRVYVLDIIGFGRTNKPDILYSFEMMANFVLDFMDTLNIEKASLIGNSMGGGISILTATLAPQRIENLILVAPAGIDKNISFILRLMTLPLLGNILTKPSKDGVVRQMDLSLYDSFSIDDDFINRVTDINLQSSNQQPFLSFMRKTANLFGFRKNVVDMILASLKKIKTPTLIVWGKEDEILSAINGQKVTKELENVQFHMMDKTGHFPQIDKAEEFNKIVLDFLIYHKN